MRKICLLFGCFCLTMLLASGCRVQQLPTVEHVRHDLQLSLQYDSISRDHYRYMWLLNDTVHITDSVFIDRWRVRVDSIVLVDSVPYPVEIPVPGLMTDRQHFFYLTGIGAWGAILAAVAIFILSLFIKSPFK